MADDDLFASLQPDEKAALAREVPEVAIDWEARLLAALAQQYGPLPAPAPVPPVTGRTIRLACRFCKGRGCLSCDTLAAREYQRQFPHGPQPLATFPTTPEGWASCRAFLEHQREVLTKEEESLP